ncbi:MAG: O-antigen ligase family protein [Bacteroidales bacterium]|jgi:hypothetical protein|nr:O-antigen ligase family protein [Bacteroidales bacterium]
MNLPVLKYKIIFLIIVLIGFQQFPVIRIGGSLKIYEILAILLLFINILTFQYDKVHRNHRIDRKLLFVWILFVLSPIISLLYNYCMLGYPKSFYIEYPNASNSFKFNYWVFPWLQLLYVAFNFATFSTIYNSTLIYERLNLKRVIMVFVIIGTIIALYSLIALMTYDVIQYLPSFIQNKTLYTTRSCGLSQEPSFYVLYQGWVVLFTYYSKRFFRKPIWLFMIILNSISLLLTLSTTLLALIIILFISIFVLKNKFKIRLLSVCVAFSIALCGYFYLLKNNLFSLFESYFVVKVSNFFSGDITHTLDSGSFRNYTARIGLHMFYDYPITGVGVGNSIYYMHEYDAQMGVISYGERLHSGSFPQNLFTCVLSEQGLIGGISLIVILLILVRLVWKNRNRNTLCRIFFIGGLFNIAAMFSIAPIYSLFLWVFLSFILGYYKYIDKLKLRNEITDIS